MSLAHARSSRGEAVEPEGALFKQIEMLADQIQKANEAKAKKASEKKEDKAENEADGDGCWVPSDPVEKSGDGGVQF